MTVDYPDWTRLIQLIGTNIMLPIDIQGSFIMMPMDIQGANITLDINILTSEATIDIAINAENVTGNINVDLNAQTITDLRIDIDAQHVGMYLKPDWEAKEGNSKPWNISGSNKIRGDYIEQTYDVPEGYVLYITQASCASFAFSAEDSDKDQIVEMVAAGVYCGGNGGCQLLLPSPPAVTHAIGLTFRVYNRANHNCYLYGSIRGYEILKPTS